MTPKLLGPSKRAQSCTLLRETRVQTDHPDVWLGSQLSFILTAAQTCTVYTERKTYHLSFCSYPRFLNAPMLSNYFNVHVIRVAAVASNKVVPQNRVCKMLTLKQI